MDFFVLVVDGVLDSCQEGVTAVHNVFVAA